MDFQAQFVEYREFFKNELNYIDGNLKKLRKIKQNATDLLEKSKYDLRKKYSPIQFVKLPGEVGYRNRLSVMKLQEILMIMD